MKYLLQLKGLLQPKGGTVTYNEVEETYKITVLTLPVAITATDRTFDWLIQEVGLDLESALHHFFRSARNECMKGKNERKPQ